MKIFQVVPYYPPHIGGMEFYVKTLSEALAAKGHDVTVFTTAEGTLPINCTINGVKVISLPKKTKIYNIPVVPSLFWTLLKEKKPDVLHSHQYPIYFSDVSAAVTLLKYTPFVLHIHVVSEAKSPFSGAISDMYYRTLGKANLHIAEKVVVPSLAYQNKLLKMHVAPTRLTVIPYGIDVEKFKNKIGAQFKEKYALSDSKIILSVGRLNYQKGFQYLIQAMPAILKQVPTAKLVIIGEGEQLGFLQALTQSIGISENVIFTGALSQEEIPEAYSAADVFVLPSLFESFGISLIEAQAAGKPVVGTNAGGAPEAFLNGETGYLVEPGNVSQLVMAVLRLLSDEALASRFGFRGQKFVGATFDFKKTVLKIVAAYNEIT